LFLYLFSIRDFARKLPAKKADVKGSCGGAGDQLPVFIFGILVLTSPAVNPKIDVRATILGLTFKTWQS
jgi:hypothetical protein